LRGLHASAIVRAPFAGLSRGELMARVRPRRNQTTEVAMARLLRCAGLGGWRRHARIPGSPDFAWPAARVAVFVDGCSWHGHGCKRNLEHRTNARAWREKIAHNQRRVAVSTSSCGVVDGASCAFGSAAFVAHGGLRETDRGGIGSRERESDPASDWRGPPSWGRPREAQFTQERRLHEAPPGA
jgi:DNA mismatch endonuclease Vsr